MSYPEVREEGEPGSAMGCDGGTIPKRHELVKGPRKVEKVREEDP